ncbi:MAG TPA: ComEC/Rec2 family competence protein [Chitinophagaceae bacterium]|nr:ComEC/Rec2 family competence protein [Chitinophagaceae bacterium]
MSFDTMRLKRYPFVRLLVCFIAGILLQWFVQLSIAWLLVLFTCISLLLLLFALIPAVALFTVQWLRGVIILALIVIAGGIVIYAKDARYNPQWAGNIYQPKQTVLVTIDEPLVEKPGSWKALATITAIQQGSRWQKAAGDVLLYFYKGKIKPRLHYGSQILLYAPLEGIKNSGNPGAFDYAQYCLFHGIAFQSFVYPGQYSTLWKDNGNSLQNALYNIRDSTIALLQKTIPGEKEQAVAQALLIGYRDKLDPDLVQAYTNTGVVHIIAISGLHLAMIYGLLISIFGLFPSGKITNIVQPVVILIVLWLFSFIAGGVPSITRAAVMFSFIIIGKALNKRANTYNTLAASAFCLLVYNPFYLWDAGFMLSYSAVVSIVAFYRPVHNWFYIKNKLLAAVWGATAVTIAAQILTLPVILFYFHRFANLFLLANFVAVPLSGIVLYGELLLVALSFIPVMAKYIGIAVGWLIWALDEFISRMNNLPFAVWDNIYADTLQTILLYAFILAVCYWLLHKASRGFTTAMLMLAALLGYTGVRYMQVCRTQKLVVYNVPHQTAIDIMQGNRFHFIGDSSLLQDGPLLRYNLKPSRIINGVLPVEDTSFHPNITNTCMVVNHTKIVVLDNTFTFNDTTAKVVADIVILTKNPKYSIADVTHAFTFKQLVFDGSNPLWKIRRWKKACDSLHLRFHSVPEQGAFELNL